MESFLHDPFFFGEEILNSMHLFIGAWFDPVMGFITALGNETFYVLMLPLLYWCYDKKLPVKIGAIFLISTTLNDMTKEIFRNPRPDPERLAEGISSLNIKYLPHQSPGFPSGHTQGAVTFWGPLFWFCRNRTVRALCLLMIILIPYSRIYLAVHFLGDVLGGYAIGFFLLLALVPAVLVVEKYYDRLHEIALMVLLLAAPLAVYNILPGKFLYNYMGVFSGFLIGALMARERIAFNPRSGIIPGIIKTAAGLAGLIIIKEGLKLILPQGALPGFFRYWLIGFWTTFAAPLIFSRFSLLRGRVT